jgi:1-acyl-sn-glycerol-3-phosphate acyltransferase
MGWAKGMVPTKWKTDSLVFTLAIYPCVRSPSLIIGHEHLDHRIIGQAMRAAHS